MTIATFAKERHGLKARKTKQFYWHEYQHTFDNHVTLDSDL